MFFGCSDNNSEPKLTNTGGICSKDEYSRPKLHILFNEYLLFLSNFLPEWWSRGEERGRYRFERGTTVNNVFIKVFIEIFIKIFIKVFLEILIKSIYRAFLKSIYTNTFSSISLKKMYFYYIWQKFLFLIWIYNCFFLKKRFRPG